MHRHPVGPPGAGRRRRGRPVEADVDAGWRAWATSAAREHLRGLALASDESWALCELTRETLAWAAADTHLAVIVDDGPRGLAFRVRDYERAADDGDGERWAEYGVAAWADQAACDALLADVARDAAALGADRTRVLVPDTVRAASDAVVVGAGLADEADFILERRLDGRG